MVKLMTSCVLVLVATAAGAGTFTVTLHNGGSFESRYQPSAAGWDENVILVLDELGMWIALDRSDVKSVVSDVEARGYGRVIDTTTKEFGFAPNDAAIPEEGDAGSSGQREETPLDRILSRSYDTPLVSEPSAVGGGFPVFGVSGAPSGGDPNQ